MQNEEPLKPPSENAMLETLTQNWSHCRHLENERLTFTGIYSGILAGTLAILGGANFESNLYLLWFLLIFSVLGIFLCYKTTREFDNHMNKIKCIKTELNLENYLGVPTESSSIISRIIRVRYIIYLFYILGICTCCYLLYKYDMNVNTNVNIFLRYFGSILL